VIAETNTRLDPFAKMFAYNFGKLIHLITIDEPDHENANFDLTLDEGNLQRWYQRQLRREAHLCSGGKVDE